MTSALEFLHAALNEAWSICEEGTRPSAMIIHPWMLEELKEDLLPNCRYLSAIVMVRLQDVLVTSDWNMEQGDVQIVFEAKE